MKKKLLALLIAITPVLIPYLAFAEESNEPSTEEWTVYSNGGCANASNQGWGGTGPPITPAQSNACFVATQTMTNYAECIALGVVASNCWFGAQDSCIAAC